MHRVQKMHTAFKRINSFQVFRKFVYPRMRYKFVAKVTFIRNSEFKRVQYLNIKDIKLKEKSSLLSLRRIQRMFSTIKLYDIFVKYAMMSFPRVCMWSGQYFLLMIKTLLERKVIQVPASLSSTLFFYMHVQKVITRA